MTIYATAKYRPELKLFEIMEYYTAFGQANSDICRGTIKIKINNKIYDKKDFASPFQHNWAGLLRKKDLSKRYINENGNIYMIKEIKVNG